MATIVRMAKKGGKRGKHTTPRKPIQIPEDWLNLARALAAKNKQPTLWYLLGLLAAAAEAAEMPHPKPPWEKQGESQ